MSSLRLQLIGAEGLAKRRAINRSDRCTTGSRWKSHPDLELPTRMNMRLELKRLTLICQQDGLDGRGIVGGVHERGEVLLDGKRT